MIQNDMQSIRNEVINKLTMKLKTTNKSNSFIILRLPVVVVGCGDGGSNKLHTVHNKNHQTAEHTALEWESGGVGVRACICNVFCGYISVVAWIYILFSCHPFVGAIGNKMLSNWICIRSMIIYTICLHCSTLLCATFLFCRQQYWSRWNERLSAQLLLESREWLRSIGGEGATEEVHLDEVIEVSVCVSIANSLLLN